ncbi:MAG: hypothetical protein LLG14_19365, partial [Nocardiaceae bacterium]|nr:hypothetical protein [Nocardiaceae bacterium]
DADILRIGTMLEDKNALDGVVAIAEHRIAGILVTAHAHDLWAETFYLLQSVGPQHRATVAAAAAGQQVEVLDGLIRAAARFDAWHILFQFAGLMTDHDLTHLASLPVWNESDVLQAMFLAGTREDLWSDAAPFLDALPPHLSVRMRSPN